MLFSLWPIAHLSNQLPSTPTPRPFESALFPSLSRIQVFLCNLLFRLLSPRYSSFGNLHVTLYSRCLSPLLSQFPLPSAGLSGGAFVTISFPSASAFCLHTPRSVPLFLPSPLFRYRAFLRVPLGRSPILASESFFRPFRAASGKFPTSLFLLVGRYSLFRHLSCLTSSPSLLHVFQDLSLFS